VSAAAASAAVATTLEAPPIAVDTVLARRELVPREPGFYAWWARRGAIAGVPRRPHRLDDDIDLFYVGISPTRASSKQDIHKRVLGHHLGGNTGSSTFRFVLAALLLDVLELTPIAGSEKTLLSSDDNRHLSRWQRDNLLVTWCVRPQPWEVEEEVISLMQPPLNCAANASHPFYRHVREARDAFRRRARPTGHVRGDNLEHGDRTA
jgi:hypothetical protein